MESKAAVRFWKDRHSVHCTTVVYLQMKIKFDNFFFVVMLGIEPRTLHLLGNYYTPKLDPRPLFGNLRSAG